MHTVSKLAKSPVLPLALIVVSCASWLVLHEDTDPAASSSASSDAVFFVEAIEENTAETVPDWTRAADVERLVELFPEGSTWERPGPTSRTAGSSTSCASATAPA